MDERQEKERKLEYLRGYRDAVNDTWAEVLDMAKKGYYAQELQIVSKTKFSDSKFKIERAIKKLEEEVETLSEPDTNTPPPMPVMAEPAVQIVLDMKPGLSYIVEESRPQRCFEIFKREMDGGRAGMAVVRKAPKQIPEFKDLGIKRMIWLTKTEKTSNDHMPIGAIGLGDAVQDDMEDDCEFLIPNNLPFLYAKISDFLGGNPGGVVLFEGIEYILSHNNFKAVLGFVQSLNEIMITKNANLIISLNPEALEPRELNLLKRDMN